MSKDATGGPGEEAKLDKNFHASNWLFAQTTHVDIPNGVLHAGSCREVVIYFKFHENRSRDLRVVGSRKSPSLIDLAHGLYNSLYYRTSRDKAMGCILLKCALTQYWAIISTSYLGGNISAHPQLFGELRAIASGCLATRPKILGL